MARVCGVPEWPATPHDADVPGRAAAKARAAAGPLAVVQQQFGCVTRRRDVTCGTWRGVSDVTQ